MRTQPAYDIIVQALTGLMSITGDPAGPPTLVGESIGDLAAGLFGSWAILAALYSGSAPAPVAGSISRCSTRSCR